MKYIFTRCLGCAILIPFLFFASAQPIISYNNFITSGLNSPIEIVNAGDASGRLFIVEKGGTIRVWVSGSSVLSTPFLTIPPSTFATGDEQGLLSMAFHPNYASNGFFYVYYTRNDRAIVVARYHATPSSNVADPGGTELIAIPHPTFDNHNGGHLQFRTEGVIHYLYFATGDGGSADDPGNNSQNDASRLGKMIRMNVDLPLPITPEVFAKGLRNPFRWSFDRSTGDMWIGDVGQNLKEEVDFWPAAGATGANFGWHCFEGNVQNTNVSPQCNPAGKIPPVFEYDNPPGAPPSAVTGGYVYRGANSALAGYYITTDFYSGQLWILNSNGTVARTQTNLAANIAAFGEDQNGELYAASITGNVVFSISATTGIPLPITLINFYGKQFAGYNELRWSTSFEQNAEKYIVEYSIDGRNFIPAGEVVASNSVSGSSYTYRHTITDSRKLFYRLQMRDLDGSSRLSAVITIGNKNTGDINVYPTILQNNILNVNSNTSIEQLSIYDITGKQVYTNALNGRQGYFFIQLPNIAGGMYFVTLRGKEYTKTTRIVVQ
jgi:glucose/arabinose dehydrogenase